IPSIGAMCPDDGTAVTQKGLNRIENKIASFCTFSHFFSALPPHRYGLSVFVLLAISVASAFAAANFTALPFTDPFAPAATPGVLSYSQPSSTVVLNENLSGVTLPITRSGTSLT